ncbi:hypothetical protein EOD39_2830 [Acipenser ruthenus]|uniref:Uncharacterized protein n=1 Tax=Acipenser ruthenus TaxID=7906 RepID=A0A444TY99_ACIRT|nr:hypothetical protein EOD39_2830 [Acipenser ruthenus]
MDHPSVKQEWLGEGDTSGEMEQLSWYIQEHKVELAQLKEQLKSRAARQRSSAAEHMGPGWVPHSATTDTQSKERQVQTCTQERQSLAAERMGPAD